MSTTNQFDKTKEETSTRRKRIELHTDNDKRREPAKRAAESEAKPATSKETSSSNESSIDKEKRRRRSANSELEMTETLKQNRRQQKREQKEEKRKNKKPRLRIFPIWLRIVVVATLSVVALCVGLMVGYGGLGDGEPSDALKWETWQHIIDIVIKEK
ncbi:DNA-directed RNA polymerase subunit beta [Ornithinibacillus sp. 179-J 7C1 HS]|uniref:DNA-directed RNA polymerase subunit beta n=1 Tax=Ornithinibacillus sp. 179-J 7C1 HS TaxID=3142384 RepID=UPI0039A1DA22